MSTAADPAVAPPAASKPRRRIPGWLELVVIVALTLALAAVTKSLLVQSFFVPSGSMQPLLHGIEGDASGDRILVEKVSYWNGDIHRGDVVVFADSQHWLDPMDLQVAYGPLQEAVEAVGLWPTDGHLVKRVMGLPGDTVVCCDAEGRVTVNGVALAEAGYLGTGVQPSQLPFTVTIPADHLWVMGDNRQNSQDSRAHMQQPGKGFVPVDDVVGKVWAIVWPLSRAGLLDRPDTFDNPALDS